MKNENIKICIISQGGSIHLKRVLKYLAEAGYEVHLITEEPCGVEGIKEHFLNHCILNLPKLKLLAQYIAYKWLLFRIKPQVLHIICIHPYNGIAALTGFHPLIITAWGADILPEQGALNSLLSRFILKQTITRADIVIGVSNEIKLLMDENKKTSTPSYLIKFGVDLEIYKPMPIKQKTDNDAVLFCPRAIAPIYNIDILIEAMLKVLSKNRNVKLVLKSYGKNDDEQYAKQLKERIKKYGIEDRVVIIEKWLSDKEFAELYNSSDIIISIPSSDGMPSSILEAMACGVPIIASDLPSMREIIHSGENGSLVPPRNVELLAENILLLLSNDKLSKQYIAKNLDFIEMKASLDGEMRKVEALYKQAIGQEKIRCAE